MKLALATAILGVHCVLLADPGSDSLPPYSVGQLRAWHAEFSSWPWTFPPEQEVHLRNDASTQLLLCASGGARSGTYGLFIKGANVWLPAGVIDQAHLPTRILPHAVDGWHDFQTFLPLWGSDQQEVQVVTYQWHVDAYSEVSSVSGMFCSFEPFKSDASLCGDAGLVHAGPYNPPETEVLAHADAADLVVVGRVTSSAPSADGHRSQIAIERIIKAPQGFTRSVIETRGGTPGTRSLLIADVHEHNATIKVLARLPAAASAPPASPADGLELRLADEFLAVLGASPDEHWESSDDSFTPARPTDPRTARAEHVYFTARIALLGLQSPRKLAALATIADDEKAYPLQRVWAVICMLDDGDASKVATVAPLLVDPGPEIGPMSLWRFGQSLGRRETSDGDGFASAIAPLAGARETELRMRAVRALGTGDADTAVPLLLAALDDAEQAVRQAAVGSLVQVTRIDSGLDLAQYEQNEPSHLAFWRNWASTPRPAPKPPDDVGVILHRDAPAPR